MGNRLQSVGGLLLALAGIWTFPDDSWSFVRSLSTTISDKPVPSLLVVGGVFLILYANRVQVRTLVGLATDSDWRIVCREWLLKSEYTVREPKPEHGDVWTIVALDQWQHEIGLTVMRSDLGILQIMFAYSFSANNKQQVADSQDLADELVLEMGRHGLLYNGLKPPMDMVQVNMRVPLDKELTEHRFFQAVDRIRGATEPFAALVERAQRNATATRTVKPKR